MRIQGFETRRIEVNGVTINFEIGGEGPPLLLLHGFPQNHLMWHKIAPRLAEEFTVVASDLRGYGDSGKPESDPEHLTYSKRTTARDQVALMQSLGHERFFVAGHDRGGRVAHRMALDHRDVVTKLAVLDIAPTYKVFEAVDQKVATSYFHWFFLIQPGGLPERMIGADPELFLRSMTGRWSADPAVFPEEVMADYIRCYSDPRTIHASCEDYRAAASIDMRHDEADMDDKLETPLLVLWGARGLVGSSYDVLAVWRERAVDVTGEALPCGHFLPEEAPEETYRALKNFFAA